jgi:hypothetical protein
MSFLEYAVSYTETADIISVSAKGHLTSEKIIEVDAQVIKMATEKNCKRVLCDYTETRFVESILRIYENPDRKRAIGFPDTIRLATIYATDEREHLFWETVCRNRGFDVRVFKKRDEASEWLQSF